MNVVARSVRFVVVAVAAKMEQIQLVDEPLFFQQIDGAIDGDQVYAGINSLCSLKNLINVQMLLGGIHHLQDDAALAGHSNAARGYRLLKFSSGLSGIEALTGRNPVRWSGGHEINPQQTSLTVCSVVGEAWRVLSSASV
jgi:hypothetical protein